VSKTPPPFRLLDTERRRWLLLQAMAKHKGAKAIYAQRIAAKGRGFRAATLLGWPAERVASECLRIGALTPQDELELLQLLYVDLEPQIQITFLDACGVRHEHGVIPEELEPPYAAADAVARAATAVVAAHGDTGRHYLQTLVTYNLPGWPGLDSAI